MMEDATPASDFETDISRLVLHKDALPGLRQGDPFDLEEWGGTVKPLSIERIFDDQTWPSGGTLFALPIELLSMIVTKIPEEALSNFALVNRACRNLSRSVQFCRISMDRTRQRLELLESLYNEGRRDSLLDDSDTLAFRAAKTMTIGQYVRSLEIHTGGDWIKREFDIARSEHYRGQPQPIPTNSGREVTSLWHSMGRRYSFYLQRIAMTIQTSTPNLVRFEFVDDVEMPRGLWNALTRSPVRELKLCHCTVFESDPFDPGLTLWPLKSLHLVHLRYLENDEESEHAVSLRAKLLSLCSQTLERLVWRDLNHDSFEDFQGLSTLANTPFPQLREVEFEIFDFLVDWVKAVIAPSKILKALRLSPIHYNGQVEELWTQPDLGYPSLKCFEIIDFGLLAFDHSFRFLECNKQLETLWTDSGLSAQILQERLLPLLSTSYLALTSLCLSFGGTEITEATLQLIGSIRTLTQLHLISRRRESSAPGWLIGHKEMRRCLSSLSRLCHLGFSEDTYVVGEGRAVDSYYSEKMLEEDGAPGHDPADDVDIFDDSTQSTVLCPIIYPTDIDERILNEDELDQRLGAETINVQGESHRWRLEKAKKWESEHANRMLRLARNYFVEFHDLEWIYFGQIYMASYQHARKMMPVQMSKRRDTTGRFLRKVFGWGPFSDDWTWQD